jgi:hypothetical protein
MKGLSGTGGAVSSKHATLLAIRCALFANNFLFNRKVRKEGAKEMQSLLPHHDLCVPRPFSAFKPPAAVKTI